MRTFPCDMSNGAVFSPMQQPALDLYLIVRKDARFVSTLETSLHDTTSPASRIPILSFFTGAGLMDIGFIEAGFEPIWHNEFDPAFVEGFEFAMQSLYGDNKGEQIGLIQNTAPLESISTGTIVKEAFGDGGKPDVFGVIGGPPCPDFSSAGRHQGKEGANGILSKTFVMQIQGLQPTFFVFENVPGLLRTEKHREYLVELLEFLSPDFAIDIDILNALDFGVPQDRHRVFLVGFRRDWLEENKGIEPSQNNTDWPAILDAVRVKVSQPQQTPDYSKELNFPWPHNERYHGAKFEYDWPDVVEPGVDPEKPKDIPEELMVGTHICNLDELVRLPNGCDSFVPYSPKFKRRKEGQVRGKSFKRLHRWRYSPSAAYGNNEVHLHPTEPRRLTVREVMRIQSVPDSYALPETMPLSKKFKTIANGVPVTLATVLARKVYAALQDPALLEPSEAQ